MRVFSLVWGMCDFILKFWPMLHMEFELIWYNKGVSLGSEGIHQHDESDILGGAYIPLMITRRGLV